MTLPQTMRAVEITQPGRPEVLKIGSRPVPQPKPGEVLIRVAAAGVNRPDVMQRTGHYPVPPGASDIPGLELAGEIVALGEGVKEWRVGDAVTALVQGGGYAEYCTAPAPQCLPVPKGMTPVEAASLPETLFTVWSNVFDRAGLKPGESFLVQGGSSGIGVAAIHWLETVSAPLLIAMGLALLWWAAARAGGLGTVLAQADALQPPGAATGGRFVLTVFVPWVTAMVGFWATLSLNIPDFTRFARSQRDQMAGQALGLLTTMPLFAFIGVAVTSATVILYGEAIWNPVDLLARLTAESGTPLLGIVALVAVLVATLTTNIAANVVAPANSFSALRPRRVSFRLGGLIAGLIGIGIFPWKLLDRYQTWLIGYSGLLGAVAGVIVCDYLLVRRGRLDLAGLYAVDGPYAYTGGVNRRALVALAAGIGTALAGLVHPALRFLFDGAWFSAALVAGGVYWGLMPGKRDVRSAERGVA